jgi:hypothetical protein
LGVQTLHGPTALQPAAQPHSPTVHCIYLPFIDMWCTGRHEPNALVAPGAARRISLDVQRTKLLLPITEMCSTTSHSKCQLALPSRGSYHYSEIPMHCSKAATQSYLTIIWLVSDERVSRRTCNGGAHHTDIKAGQGLLHVPVQGRSGTSRSGHSMHHRHSTRTFTRSTISGGRRSSSSRLPFTASFKARVYSG